MSYSAKRHALICRLRGALALLALVALTLAAAGCDSGGGEDDKGNIDGLWASRGAEEDAAFIGIDRDERRVTAYFFLDEGGFEGCYVGLNFEIVSVDGDVYTLLVEDGAPIEIVNGDEGGVEEVEVRITADGDVLAIEELDSGEVLRYDRSSQSTDDLRPECNLSEEGISGLWASLGEDEFYLDIDTGAREIVNYDYLGDDYDDFGDCYLINEIPIIGIDGDAYTILNDVDGDGERDEVEVRLRVERVDGEDVLVSTSEDEDGNAVTFRYERSGRSVEEFAPECEIEGDGENGGGSNLLRGSHRSGPFNKGFFKLLR